MEMFLVTLAAFGLAITGMAVGVMVTGKKISGSCGGMAGRVQNELGESSCSICGRSVEEQKASGCGDQELADARS